MYRTIRIILGSVFSLLFFLSANAQEISVDLGPSEFGVNQIWTITITVQNERLKNYSPFPEISGMVKRGTSSSTSTNYTNGRMSSSQSIIQNYQATGEGTITIPDFTIVVNDEEISVQGKTLTVGAAVQRRSYNDPFDDFFNRRGGQQQPEEFIDVEAEAFLALTTDKSEVYLGEGFRI